MDPFKETPTKTAPGMVADRAAPRSAQPAGEVRPRNLGLRFEALGV